MHLIIVLVLKTVNICMNDNFYPFYFGPNKSFLKSQQFTVYKGEFKTTPINDHR